MRCPADIKHYHVSQLARRLRGKYIDPRSDNLAKRIKEIENKKAHFQAITKDLNKSTESLMKKLVKL